MKEYVLGNQIQLFDTAHTESVMFMQPTVLI